MEGVKRCCCCKLCGEAGWQGGLSGSRESGPSQLGGALIVFTGVSLPQFGVLRPAPLARHRRATAPASGSTTAKFKDGAQKLWGIVGRVTILT